MAFGDVMMQPGYTWAPKSMMGTTGAAGTKTAKKYRTGGGAGISGSFGFPKYGAYTGAKGAGAGGPSTVTPPTIAPTTANLNVPPGQSFEGATYGDPNLDYMANFAKGMIDPESDYYKRLSMGMQRQIGAQSAAQQRAARLRQAWGGGGVGQTGELAATTADIGQAGLEAQGTAEANLRLAAPGMGMQAMQSTFAPRLGYQQLTEGSRQFGAGFGERQRQFGANLGLSQQQLAAQQAIEQARMNQQANVFNAQQQNQWNLQNQQNQWNAMMQQMAMQYL